MLKSLNLTKFNPMVTPFIALIDSNNDTAIHFGDFNTSMKTVGDIVRNSSYRNSSSTVREDFNSS
jgi:hypothetical protein